MHMVEPADMQSNGQGNGTTAQLDLGFAERRVEAVDTMLTAHATIADDEIVLPTEIVKRDGRTVAFDVGKIEHALTRCFQALDRDPFTPIPELALRVVNIMAARRGQASVESVQDAVELTLQAAGEFEAAKAYILYRADHAKQRHERPIPEEVRAAFAEADQYFPTPLQKFQYFDKYSRFDYDKGRRETWIETVDRAVAYLHELGGSALPSEDYERIRRFILEMRSMPSMRLLAMAGAPARRTNVAIYNCSYQPVESIDSFVEALLISMSGCGVGYSVESQYVENFPRVKRQRGLDPLLLVVEDSAEGWGEALRTAMQAWLEGDDVRFDFSRIRPAGAPLRTKGGRASGPGPLKTMLEFVRGRILARQGTFLRPLDAHDMMCAVGNAAVQGGVRRTAMISLFDYDDQEMLLSKSGEFERDNSQRWNANNSAVWPESGLSQLQVLDQVMAMVKSERGEPGIFNRQAAIALRPSRRTAAEFGTNPCVTGDAWVAVADGRGRARMSDLVAAGEDVDVYTVKDGKLVVRKMRNPRKTGTDTPIYRVTFADGTFIRVTQNHKFVLTNGTRKQAVDLRPNDALTSMSVYSYKKRDLPNTEKVSYDAEGSYRMLQFSQALRKSEHRFLYHHHTGTELVGVEEHLHHRDFDGRNNRLANLVQLTAEEHAREHRERMLGASNPVHQMTDAWRANISRSVQGLANGHAKALTNEQLEQRIKQFIRGLGRMATLPEYQTYAKHNGLPQSFSAYRRAHFGGDVSHTLRAIGARLGVMPVFEAEARTVTDLPVIFRDGHTLVVRQCEGCGCLLEVRLTRREQSFCRSCSQREYYRRNGRTAKADSLLRGHERRHVQVRERQMRLYNDLLFRLGRHPSKLEWQAECRAVGVSPEVSRESSPFRSWEELKTTALAANHRVVSVEPDGSEDVYTGTVDETHTFFATGTERINGTGRSDMAYVLNVQCGEIVLRPFQFCNLSIAVARQSDTLETLREKVEVASLIGTIQSMATNFPGLRPLWKQNCEEERLLGVDITGQLDSKAAQDPSVQRTLKQVAVETNRVFAERLGINQSAAVTTVKPSGNSSQLLDCSSGLHARWAPYYERNVRVAATSPVFKVLRDAGVPMDPENGQTPETATTWVIHFPVKSPEGAITRRDRTALEQCDYWLRNKVNWTEHNPSVTITYRPDEVVDLMQWIWAHRDLIGGMAFLPAFDAQYAQLPYIEISKEEYERRIAAFPEIDFSKLFRYESSDLTNAAQELACLAGVCEVDS